MTTTLFGTFNDVSSRPPRLIRSRSGCFYAVAFSDCEAIDGYIIWNDEVFGVNLICGPEDFYDRFEKD